MPILLLLLLFAAPVSAIEQQICDEIAVELAHAVERDTLTELEAMKIYLNCLKTNN